MEKQEQGNYSSLFCLSVRANQGWWPYAVTYTVLFATGLLLLSLILTLTSVSFKFNRMFVLNSKIVPFFDVLFDPQSITGKVQFTLTLVFNITYINIMLWRSSTRPLYDCSIADSTPVYLVVETLSSCYLIINSIARLITAKHRIIRWISLLTLVDIFTLSHPFVSLLCGYDWLGLRALRFLWLLEASKILKALPDTINSEDIVKIAKIVSRFIGVWLSSSGMIQLLETSGDPWDAVSDDDDISMSFWSSTYFTMITMTTVGYGDVTVGSDCGQMFTMFIIVLGFALYMFSFPTLLEILLGTHQSSKFRQSYSNLIKQEGLLIVVGSITEKSVSCFLKEVLHPDKQGRETFSVILLHPSCPTPGLCSILKSNYTRVQYYQGSALNYNDLMRCGLSIAKSVIVLADCHCSNPIKEDNANLLRVASIKNALSSIPIILQLLMNDSKKLLKCLPGWVPGRDVPLCLFECKLKILAQTCITPGFSTLLCNLFFATGVTSSGMKVTLSHNSMWRELYTTGACSGISSVVLSVSFIGMRTAQVGRICYEELGLTLISVGKGEKIIQQGSIGYFIANHLVDVQVVRYYCFKCHGAGRSRNSSPCSCHSPQGQDETNETSSFIDESYTFNGDLCQITSPTCPIQSPYFPPPTSLNDHVVVCVFACSDSMSIGLMSLFAPLQQVGDTENSIVVVSNPDYFQREWSGLEDTSHIYFVPGHPLDSATLSEAQIESCSVCILLTGLAVNEQDNRSVAFIKSTYIIMSIFLHSQEHGIEDNEVVLCALKLRHKLGEKVSIISDLAIDSSIHLLDDSSQSGED